MSNLNQFLGGGRLNDIFVVSNSGTFTVPSGYSKLRIHAWGAGGGGATGGTLHPYAGSSLGAGGGGGAATNSTGSPTAADGGNGFVIFEMVV